jgi:hypothetical protein
MIIIGMTGPIGHGKSTFAKAAMELEPSSTRLESSMIIAEVANALHDTTTTVPAKDDIDAINVWLRPLPSILLEITHSKVDYDQIKLDMADIESHPIDYEKLMLHLENLARNPALLKQRIDTDNKEAYRPILQWLGGYLIKKVDPSIWYKEVVRRTREIAAKGTKLCIIGGLRFPLDAQYVREMDGKIIKVYRPGHLQYDMLDPTERERENIHPDSTLVSNGTIEDVKNCAAQVLEDIKNNNLQKTYYAKTP